MSTTHTLAAGETLPLPDATTTYQLQEGALLALRLRPDGTPFAVRHLLPGDAFGEDAFTEATVVEALIPSVVVAHAGFDPAERARSMEAQLRRMADLAYTNRLELTERLLVYMRAMAETAGLPSERGVALPLTHNQLAMAVGSTRETVTKMLAGLRDQGLLTTGYGKVVLHERMAA